jgi:hypothetical protein
VIQAAGAFVALEPVIATLISIPVIGEKTFTARMGCHRRHFQRRLLHERRVEGLMAAVSKGAERPKAVNGWT